MVTLTPFISRAHIRSLLLVLPIPTNTDTPPAAVKVALTRLYPTAKHVKFDKENGDYEASLAYNGKDVSVILDAWGKVKGTDEQLTKVIAQLMQDWLVVSEYDYCIC